MFHCITTQYITQVLVDKFTSLDLLHSTCYIEQRPICNIGSALSEILLRQLPVWKSCHLIKWNVENRSSCRSISVLIRFSSLRCPKCILIAILISYKSTVCWSERKSLLYKGHLLLRMPSIVASNVWNICYCEWEDHCICTTSSHHDTYMSTTHKVVWKVYGILPILIEYGCTHNNKLLHRLLWKLGTKCVVSFKIHNNISNTMPEKQSFSIMIFIWLPSMLKHAAFGLPQW